MEYEEWQDINQYDHESALQEMVDRDIDVQADEVYNILED